MTPELVPTLFDYLLSDIIDENKTLNRTDAETLFSFFQQHPFFKWQDNHNGCEAKADAICVLLNEWNITHYKAWVFSGSYLKNHIGGLTKNWNYHVAPLLPVKENGSIILYVIDPATGNSLQPLYDWAANITQYPHSYHFIKHSYWYIFNSRNITPDNWHRRNRQNRKWMIQGLAGINGLNAIGKARLCFNKGKLKNTVRAFRKIKQQSPL